MAWTAPITAAANSTFTAANWNQTVRDNLAIQAAAIATTSGRVIVSTAANVVSEREVAQSILDTAASTSSTSYTTLGSGPAITINCTSGALIWISLNISIQTVNTALASINITGATTSAPADGRGIMEEGPRATASPRDDRVGCTFFHGALNAGNNTFTIQEKVTGGGPMTVTNRRIVGMAL